MIGTQEIDLDAGLAIPPDERNGNLPSVGLAMAAIGNGMSESGQSDGRIRTVA